MEEGTQRNQQELPAATGDALLSGSESAGTQAPEEHEVTSATSQVQGTTHEETEGPADARVPELAGRRWRPGWRSVAAVALLLILLLGAYFRFTGLNWDDSYHLHPDERFLTDTASLLRSTDLLTYFKTSESPLNPYNVGKTFYVYGNLPMTATRLVAEGVDAFCLKTDSICNARFVFFDGLQLVGRFLSAALDLVSILFVYLIGQKLYDWRAGLVGALLMAAAVLPIQQSHFFTMDNWAAAFTTIAMYAAVQASFKGNRLRWWLLFGIALGLAVASRINMAPLALIAGFAALAWLIRCANDADEYFGWRYLIGPAGARLVQQAIVGLLFAAVVSMVVFRVAQPYAFADSQIYTDTTVQNTGQPPSQLKTIIGSLVGFNPLWRANMSEIQTMQSPDAMFPPALQWVDRTPVVFPFVNIVFWGMGLTAGLAAWGAFAWALYRIFRGRPDWLNHLLPVAWVGLYFAFMATRWVKSIRYFLPIYPFLLLLAGWALIELWKRAAGGRVRQLMVAGLIALVVVPTLLWANAFVGIYRQPVTRVRASEWIFDNVPSGATLVYATAGAEKSLQLPVRRFEFTQQGPPLSLYFEMPEDGILTGVRFNYLSDPDIGQPADSGESLSLELIEPLGALSLARVDIGAGGSLNLDDSPRKVQATLPSVPAVAGQRYLIVVKLTGSNPVNLATSALANEHWDDALPVRYEGRDPFAFYYDSLPDGLMPVTYPDSEAKRNSFYRWLEDADYIVLSSQRAVWSTPRLPLNYPLTSRYYEALFSGELGFKLVQDFHADFHIGPLYISDTAGTFGWSRPPEVGWPPPGDLAAEEAFSVYDHPPVWIFAKTEEYSSEIVARVLGAVDLGNVAVLTPGQATKADNGLMLDGNQVQVQRHSGTFSDVVSPDGLLSRQPWLAAVVWWLAVVLLGWLAFPLIYAALPGLPDKGFPLARIAAILLVSYFTWITGSLGLLQNTRGAVFLGLGLMVLASLVILLRQRRELVLFLRQNIQLIVIVELSSLILYLIFILIRFGNPDVWDVIWGGEKPMDLSYFTAVLKSTSFPPYDPWFAGGYINYYYYGFVYVGVLVKLLGIAPTVAYNLILPMLASSTGIGAFSVAYNLVASRQRRLNTAGAPDVPSNSKAKGKETFHGRAVAAGMMAALAVVILGNLVEITVLVRASYLAGTPDLISTSFEPLNIAAQTIDGASALVRGKASAPISTGDWFWSATRAINFEPGEAQPINEFPFFTFLYGDLHAHMIALPITLLALGWAVSLVLPGGRYRRPGGYALLQWLLGALAIGVLRATNTWDFPTYLLIGMMAMAYSALRTRAHWSWTALGEGVVQALLLAAVAVILFWPFAASYKVPYGSFSLWPGSYTRIGNYLLIYGLFLFAAVTYLVIEWLAWFRGQSRRGISLPKQVLPAALGLAGYSALLVFLVHRGYDIAPIALTTALAAGLLTLRARMPVERRAVLILIAMAFALTLMVEIIVLDGDIGRMNTVFKFYMQSWVLLSITGATGLVWAWPIIARRANLRISWAFVLAVLLMLAALYPLLATKAKWDTRMSTMAPYTLDGMAFMETTTYADRAYDGQPRIINLANDYKAIRWMQRNIQGTPVIAEAHSDNPYRSVGNRVSMYTGLPAIVGWDWHQRQQRAVLPASIVSNRIADVQRLYSTSDPIEALAILEKYDVGYIYVGELENAYYAPQGLAKFDRLREMGLLKEVYDASGVRIFEVTLQ